MPELKERCVPTEISCLCMVSNEALRVLALVRRTLQVISCVEGTQRNMNGLVAPRSTSRAGGL